jgi:hypothetical protein
VIRKVALLSPRILGDLDRMRLAEALRQAADEIDPDVNVARVRH